MRSTSLTSWLLLSSFKVVGLEVGLIEEEVVSTFPDSKWAFVDWSLFVSSSTNSLSWTGEAVLAGWVVGGFGLAEGVVGMVEGVVGGLATLPLKLSC